MRRNRDVNEREIKGGLLGEKMTEIQNINATELDFMLL